MTCNGGKEYVNFKRVADTPYAHLGRYLATRRNRARLFGIFERAALRDLKNFSKVRNCPRRFFRVSFWSLCRDELGLKPKLYLGHLITELIRDHLEYPFGIECRVIGYFLSPPNNRRKNVVHYALAVFVNDLIMFHIRPRNAIKMFLDYIDSLGEGDRYEGVNPDTADVE